MTTDSIKVTVPATVALTPERVGDFFCEMSAHGQASCLAHIAEIMLAYPNGGSIFQVRSLADQLGRAEEWAQKAKDWLVSVATAIREQGQ